jgi:uncharacterized protein YjiS (DUF1127 family)
MLMHTIAPTQSGEITGPNGAVVRANKVGDLNMNTATGARQQSSFSVAGSRLLQLCGRRLRIVGSIHRMKRTRDRLHALPDHILKDIGIARCEILSLTRFHELDPSRRRRT